MIRIGIVGTGGMAHAHARAYAEMRGVELTACHDVQPQRVREFARRYGFRHVAGSLEELLDRVDAVSVVTPDRYHAPICLSVLRAERHLLCEKPLTVTLAEARRVARAAQAAQRRGVMHMINFSYRHAAAFQEAVKLVQRGALGDLRHVHSHYLQSWLVSGAWGHWSDDTFLWRLQTAAGSGGVLGDIGCHILDFTTAVAGDLKAVRATTRTFAKISRDGRAHRTWKGKKLDANDSVVAELHFANGALGACHMTRWATGRSNQVLLEVHGTRGALHIDLAQSWTELHVCLGRDCRTDTWKTRQLKAAPTNYRRFIRAIRTGKPAQPDVLRGAHVQAMLDACERSAATGRLEKVRKAVTVARS